jgi:arsenate reductase (thioredoxin)
MPSTNKPIDVIIYHNPECGTSRNTLGLIRNAGIEPHVIEYLKTLPSRALLKSLIERMGVLARDVVRIKGTPYHDLNLDDPSVTDDQLLDAMMVHPILINRPIVVTPLGVKSWSPLWASNRGHPFGRQAVPAVADSARSVARAAARRVSQGGWRAGGRQRRPSRVVAEATMLEVVPNKVFNVLFICTGNSARSIMAEAILNRAGQGQFRAFSAGSHPKGHIHPYAIEILERMHYDVSALRSKSWTEFTGPDGPKLDFAFTLCDDAAAETCPVWPGQPMTAHWGLPDPAAKTGTEAEMRFAFADTMRMLTNRINIFVSLPMKSLDALSLQNQLDAIGQNKDRAPDPGKAAE